MSDSTVKRKPRSKTNGLHEQRMKAVEMVRAGTPEDEVAKIFGRSKQTIQKWRHHPKVCEDLDAMERGVIDKMEDLAARTVKKAWDTLYHLMAHSPDHRVRLEAAKTTLDRRGYPVETRTETTGNNDGPRVYVQLTTQQALQLAKGE